MYIFFFKPRYNVHLAISHIHYCPTDVLCKQTVKSADTSYFNNTKEN